MLLGLLLLPLQLATLVLLHVCFALNRFVVLVRRLVQRAAAEWRRTRRRRRWQGAKHAPESSDMSDNTFTTTLSKDRWQKLPRHFAVVFVPGTSLFEVVRASRIARWTAEKGSGYNASETSLDKLAQDVQRLIVWAEALEMAELSVYDEQGLLEQNATQLVSRIGQSLPVMSPVEECAGYKAFRVAAPKLYKRSDEALPRQEIDSGCGVSDTGMDGTSTPSSPRPACLVVNILSRRSGRPQLAKVAQELAIAREKGIHTADSLTTELVQETIESSGLSEPQLLLVLGGPYLRLHGFPPWPLRLTEMYHHPSPSWLPTPRLTWKIMRRALDVYGGAQMRFGR